MLFFLAAAATSWLKLKSNLGSCLASRPDCSTALATWVLCFITTFAFVAAYEAAKRAGDTLQTANEALAVEKQPILGMWLCTDPDHSIPRAAFYVVEGQLQTNKPQGFSDTAFRPVEFDFENLGRAALLNVVVYVAAEPHAPVPVSIGNIGSDKNAHVTIWLPWGAPRRPILTWHTPAKVGGDEIEFTPLPRVRVERTLASAVSGEEDQAWEIAFVASASASDKESADEPKRD